MMINDSLWVDILGSCIFERFPVLNGWGREDLFVLWAVITFSFGIAFGLFAQALRCVGTDLSRVSWTTTWRCPKMSCCILLVGQIRPANLGDLFFGPGPLLMLFVDMSPMKWVWFLIGRWTFRRFDLLVLLCDGWLAWRFYVGSSEGISSTESATL
jgi:hypothetical protein